jgi:hypothetical protein
MAVGVATGGSDVSWTVVAWGVLVGCSVAVGGTAVADGIVVTVGGSEMGVTAVSGLAVQAANKEKKHPQMIIMRAMDGVEHI